MSERKTSTIKFFDEEKGFGFLKNYAGNDYFLHVSNLEGNQEPSKADLIEFTPAKNDRGPVAKNAKIIESD